MFTLRAILSLMLELGPEFLRGKHWVSVISSSVNRLLKGTVRLPRVHLCLSSFTCALTKKICFRTYLLFTLFGAWSYKTKCYPVPPPRAPASWDCGRGMRNSLPTEALWSCIESLWDRKLLLVVKSPKTIGLTYIFCALPDVWSTAFFPHTVHTVYLQLS